MGSDFISLFYNLQPANFTFSPENSYRISRLCLCDCLFEPKESERQVDDGVTALRFKTTAKPRRLT
jgi:hypothetical protein